MSKELVKKAGTAGVEQLLQTFMPTVLSRLDALDKRMLELHRDVEARFQSIENRFEKVSEDFEKTQSLINELGIRINTVGTRLETYSEIEKLSTSRLDNWLERLVRVEMNQQAVRRRKAS